MVAAIRQRETEQREREQLILIQGGRQQPARLDRRHAPAMLRRRRTVAAGAFLASTVGGLIAVQAALGAGGGPLTTTGPPGGGVPAAPHVWVVKPGDTLWAIAEALRPGTDVRPLVDRLASEAGGRPLQAGQRLVEP